jgi:hypothetical protein
MHRASLALRAKKTKTVLQFRARKAFMDLAVFERRAPQHRRNELVN